MISFFGIIHTHTRAMRESDLYKINPYIVIDWFLQQLTRSLNFIVFFLHIRQFQRDLILTKYQ